jgi:hypothetical protein
MLTANDCTCYPDEFSQLTRPLFRLICHCKTCQLYTGQAYNDEYTFLMRDCPGLDLKRVTFKSYQSPLSPIKRGTCKACGKLAYCIGQIGPAVLFVMVPSSRLNLEQREPVAHVYYDRRVADIDDTRPKVSGHVRSQATIQWAVLSSWAIHSLKA